MITVSEALDRLFALAKPLGTQTVPLLQAAGRVLAEPVAARRDQPPFPASAMDGYAVTEALPGTRLTVIGESAAGHGFDRPVGPGQAVRIFTGAPVPESSTRIVIQEDVTRDAETITIGEKIDENPYIRPAGTDFRRGFCIKAPRRLSSADIALLASMNIATVPVFRRPDVALISTGDELVMPGEQPGRDLIIASNTFGLFALMQELGAKPRLLPIARDTPQSLTAILSMASDADLVLTIGGASVGDHDLVAQVSSALGMDRAFYKVAMRPGKPLMSGRLGSAMMMGLPGNPVSAMVCGHVFVAPVVRAMTGLPAEPAPRRQARLATALPANGPREHYMRATLDEAGLHPFDRQDSSLLTVLGEANALIVRPRSDSPRAAGQDVDYLPL